MVMGLEAIGAQLETVAARLVEGRAAPDWPIKIVAAKYNAVEGAWKIADRALEVSGGFGMFKKSEMERLFRDARAGRFHPANSSLAHELIGKLALGDQSGRSAALGLVECQMRMTNAECRKLVLHSHFLHSASKHFAFQTPKASTSQLQPQLARRRHVADERGCRHDRGAGEVAFAAQSHPVLPIAIERGDRALAARQRVRALAETRPAPRLADLAAHRPEHRRNRFAAEPRVGHFDLPAHAA